MKTLSWLAALLALVALSSPAHSGGFLVSKIGGDSAGPTSSLPSSLYWNPAALGPMKGSYGFLDNNLIFRRLNYTRDTTSGGSNGRVYDEAVLTTATSQPMVVLVSDFGTDDFTFALGAYGPFGSSVEWDDPHGAQRWQSIFGSLKGAYITPAVVWTVTEGLHLSLSASLVRIDLVSYRAIDLGGLAGGDAPLEEPGNEGRAHLDFRGNEFAYGAGFLWEVGDFRLGGSYSSEVHVALDGTLAVIPPRNDFWVNLVGSESGAREEATFQTTWPRAVRGGFAWLPTNSVRVTLNVEWVDWSQHEEIFIDVKNNEVGALGNIDQRQQTRYVDTVNVRVGARYMFTPRLGFFGGVGAENSAIPPDRISPQLFDAGKAGGGAGVVLGLHDNVDLTVSYTHIAFFDVATTSSYESPPPTGDYAQQVGFLNTNLSWKFAE
jgi:long-subunit fatty acid transport protein